MRRYEYEYVARVVVHAENVAQADQLTKKLRLTNARVSGYKRPKNNREGIAYTIMVHSEKVLRK